MDRKSTDIPINLRYNIIAELLNDGAGDYAWIKNLVSLLINNNVPIDNITVIGILVEDLGMELSGNHDINTYTIDPLKTIIEEYQKDGSCITISNTTQVMEDKSKIAFNFESKKDFQEEKKDLKFFSDRIGNILKPELKVLDVKKTNNIIDMILTAFKKSANIKKNDYVCYYDSKKWMDSQIDSIRNQGYSGFSILQIALQLAEYPGLKLLLLPNVTYGQELLNSSTIVKNSINLLFRTRDEGVYKFSNILIREGGHTLGSAYNCSPKFGYIHSKPEGSLEKLTEFAKNYDLDIKKTTIAYLSATSKTVLPTKLSKYIKILSFVPTPPHTIYLPINFSELFDKGNSKLDRDILVCSKDKFPDSKTNYNFFYAKFNNKVFKIIQGEGVNLQKNGFNFAYLVKHSNEYCFLSGDSSYMEGLTQNKRTIHLGLDHKYLMISAFEGEMINKLRLSLKSNITNNIDDSKNNDLDLIKAYAGFISHPDFLRHQSEITKKDFYETLKSAIIDFVTKNSIKQEGGNMYYKKYLKYKNKYIDLKNKLN